MHKCQHTSVLKFKRAEQVITANTHPSLERFPDGVSIAHVSKYPENDNAGLEPVHSSLRATEEMEGGGEEGN